MIVGNSGNVKHSEYAKDEFGNKLDLLDFEGSLYKNQLYTHTNYFLKYLNWRKLNQSIYVIT